MSKDRHPGVGQRTGREQLRQALVRTAFFSVAVQLAALA